MKLWPKELGQKMPSCETLGDLRAALAHLPDDLPVTVGCSEGVKPVVFNVEQEDVHLSFEEDDGTFD